MQRRGETIDHLFQLKGEGCCGFGGLTIGGNLPLFLGRRGWQGLGGRGNNHVVRVNLNVPSVYEHVYIGRVLMFLF